MSRYQHAKAGPNATVPDSAGVSSEGSAIRILVVDDEPGVRMLITRLLSGAGYVVDVAEDGYDAWRMLQERSYAALILDLRMPGKGGDVLYEQLRRVDDLLSHRVIFITGDTLNRREREFVAATGNPLIEKPFDLNVLQHQLQSLFKDDA